MQEVDLTFLKIFSYFQVWTLFKNKDYWLLRIIFYSLDIPSKLSFILLIKKEKEFLSFFNWYILESTKNSFNSTDFEKVIKTININRVYLTVPFKRYKEFYFNSKEIF